MKTILTLSSLLAFGSLTLAQKAPAANSCSTSACAASQCEAGACGEDCCGPMLKLAVTGLKDEATAQTTEIAMNALAGITHCSTCTKSGTVMVKYDPEKMKVADVEKAVAKYGLKVTGHRTAFKVTGLTCGNCANHLTAVLGKEAGVVNVDKVCHMSGHAAITFDPSKTTEAKLKAAINATKYKVAEAKKAPAEPAPQS